MAKEYFTPAIVPPGSSIEGSYLHVVNITDLPISFFDGTGDDWIGARKRIAACSGGWGGIYRTKESNPTSGDYVKGWIYRPIRRSTRIDIQWTFLFPDVANDKQAEEEIVLPDLEDGKPVTFRIKIVISTKKVYLLDETNSYVEVGTLYNLSPYVWNIGFLQIDRLNNSYRNLLINDQLILNTEKKAYKDDSAAAINYRKLTDILTTLSSAAAEMWIDEIILRVI